MVRGGIRHGGSAAPDPTVYASGWNGAELGGEFPSPGVAVIWRQHPDHSYFRRQRGKTGWRVRYRRVGADDVGRGGGGSVALERKTPRAQHLLLDGYRRVCVHDRR